LLERAEVAITELEAQNEAGKIHLHCGFQRVYFGRRRYDSKSGML